MRIILRSIKPKKPPLDVKALRRELDSEFRGRLKNQALALARRTVSNWRTIVTFAVRFFSSSRGIGFDLTPSGPGRQIWIWVSEGTRGHFVRPRRAKVLRFRAGYISKTRPGRIDVRAGGPRGPFVTSRGHWVRGITPRKFPQSIAKGMRPNFARDLQNAIRRAVRRSR